MSDYLFAHPSFLSGAARSLDLGGIFDSYNESQSPQKADERAMRSDWSAVGSELRLALDKAKAEFKDYEREK